MIDVHFASSTRVASAKPLAVRKLNVSFDRRGTPLFRRARWHAAGLWLATAASVGLWFVIVRAAF